MVTGFVYRLPEAPMLDKKGRFWTNVESVSDGLVVVSYMVSLAMPYPCQVALCIRCV